MEGSNTEDEGVGALLYKGAPTTLSNPVVTPTDRVGVLDCEAARLGGPAGAQGARAESGQRGVIEGAL